LVFFTIVYYFQALILAFEMCLILRLGKAYGFSVRLAAPAAALGGCFRAGVRAGISSCSAIVEKVLTNGIENQ
jgi:hypothetical protein